MGTLLIHLEIWQKKENNELEKRNRAFLIYQDENGIARINVRFEGEDVWLNVEQMMELFDAFFYYHYKLSEDIFIFYLHYLYKPLFMSKIIKS